jgi:hypothetical protein
MDGVVTKSHKLVYLVIEVAAGEDAVQISMKWVKIEEQSEWHWR